VPHAKRYQGCPARIALDVRGGRSVQCRRTIQLVGALRQGNRGVWAPSPVMPTSLFPLFLDSYWPSSHGMLPGPKRPRQSSASPAGSDDSLVRRTCLVLIAFGTTTAVSLGAESPLRHSIFSAASGAAGYAILGTTSLSHTTETPHHLYGACRKPANRVAVSLRPQPRHHGSDSRNRGGGWSHFGATRSRGRRARHLYRPRQTSGMRPAAHDARRWIPKTRPSASAVDIVDFRRR
jgi:hypothetical protein